MHWLQFRGPNASGIAPQNADPPIHFSADTNLLWKTEILPGYSSPCIVNDRIFLTGYNKEDSLLYTFAINRESGEIVWADSVKADTLIELHSVNSYANPTIVSDGKKIYSAFSEYGMVAYDLEGNRAWEYKHKPIAWYYGGSCSPIIYDSTIVLIVNPDEDCRIVGLDPESGDSVWNIRAEKDDEWYSFAIRATPVIRNDLMILHFSFCLVAYDMVKREPVWWMNIPSSGTATPVINEDNIYVNAWGQMGEKSVNGLKYSFEEFLGFYDINRNRKLEQSEIPDSIMMYHRPESPELPKTSMRLNEDIMFQFFEKNQDMAYDQEEWESMLEFLAPYMEDHGMLALPLDGKGERPSTDILWKITDDTPEVPSPLLVGDYVLFVKSGGIVTVINRNTGEIVKHGRIGAPGAYLSSPMLAGNRIYTCSYNGTVSILSGDDFSTLATNKLKEKIGASPVAVDDVLYIRTDKHLYAFRNQ